MDLTYAELSSQGPVRSNNEDRVAFWEPAELEEKRDRGALAVLADGVGGHGQGEVASRLAVEETLRKFREAKPGMPSRQVLFQIFTSANVVVYDQGMHEQSQGDQVGGRMATTLTAAIFRNNEITIGHVGDCRAYLIQEGQIRRVTADHSYAAMQQKLGLLSEQEAAASAMRSVLTRSIGREPTVQVDICALQVNRGDRFVQCSDGLHQCVTEEEILEIVTHAPPADACRELVALAERRGTDDNLSVQVVQIDLVEQVMYYRGLPIYCEPERPMSHEIEVGQILDERFHITEVISRSGMASIFKARDLKTDQALAVKVPFMQFESDPAFFSRFQREESIGRTLDHPYILKILPLDEEKSRPYIAMELLKGQTLRQALKSARQMPIEHALDITRRMCEALEYLHKKEVIHRDLKPENVMLCDDGSLRIMDFGIAKAAGLRRLTFTGFSSSMGTPDYMAPEQVKGKRGDARTDIYSLGAMLYEMVTGQPPFEGASPYAIMNARLVSDPVAPRKLKEAISPQLEEVILHALEQQPYNRYPSAAAMKAELENLDKVQLTGRCDRLRPPVAWISHWRTVRLVVLSALVPILIFGLLFLLARHPWSPTAPPGP
ncbi:MAG: bifunctional protein-serine/threonine kinase/phosphatase [Thermoguttaceae bacterium]